MTAPCKLNKSCRQAAIFVLSHRVDTRSKSAQDTRNEDKMRAFHNLRVRKRGWRGFIATARRERTRKHSYKDCTFGSSSEEAF